MGDHQTDVPDDDLLDGCELDFETAAVSESVSEMLPLFPDAGEMTIADIQKKAKEWKGIFGGKKRA